MHALRDLALVSFEHVLALTAEPVEADHAAAGDAVSDV